MFSVASAFKGLSRRGEQQPITEPARQQGGDKSPSLDGSGVLAGDLVARLAGDYLDELGLSLGIDARRYSDWRQFLVTLCERLQEEDRALQGLVALRWKEYSTVFHTLRAIESDGKPIDEAFDTLEPLATLCAKLQRDVEDLQHRITQRSQEYNAASYVLRALDAGRGTEIST